jgi:alpha-beta hydrolase superfamily lysophospholipase
MEHTEGKFAARDGLSLYYQAWRPDGNPKAVLLVVHGWAEHSGRYSNLVNYFGTAGPGVSVGMSTASLTTLTTSSPSLIW